MTEMKYYFNGAEYKPTPSTDVGEVLLSIRKGDTAEYDPPSGGGYRFIKVSSAHASIDASNNTEWHINYIRISEEDCISNKSEAITKNSLMFFLIDADHTEPLIPASRIYLNTRDEKLAALSVENGDVIKYEGKEFVVRYKHCTINPDSGAVGIRCSGPFK